ncbi:hypothetical protein OBV_42130 [Oscillibacter valericigenes Sjm18-20]|nr:hypothetical protein OBV_42130 [Oscillibacter valericigenes Sjm18-20]
MTLYVFPYSQKDPFLAEPKLLLYYNDSSKKSKAGLLFDRFIPPVHKMRKKTKKAILFHAFRFISGWTFA